MAVLGLGLGLWAVGLRLAFRLRSLQICQGCGRTVPRCRTPSPHKTCNFYTVLVGHVSALEFHGFRADGLSQAISSRCRLPPRFRRPIVGFPYGSEQPEEVDPIAMGDEETLLVGSVTEVAVSVTVPPEGAVAGDV